MTEAIDHRHIWQIGLGPDLVNEAGVELRGICSACGECRIAKIGYGAIRPLIDAMHAAPSQMQRLEHEAVFGPER